MKKVFFYGLFMDEQLLKDKGLDPQNTQLASLLNYQLKIGARATLAEQNGAICHGSIMDLIDEELGSLYSGEGVQDYVPIDVNAIDVDGNEVKCQTYILPLDMLSGRNSEYAKQLAEVAQKLGIPGDYIAEISSWIN